MYIYIYVFLHTVFFFVCFRSASEFLGSGHYGLKAHGRAGGRAAVARKLQLSCATVVFVFLR